MLTIRDLSAAVAGKQLLHGVDLELGRGEVHAVMGPNGSGKSTLARVLCGHPDYEVVSGEVLFEGKDLLSLAPEERARQGVFLSFQYPVEIPGVSVATFLQEAVNAVRDYRGKEPYDAFDFLELAKKQLQRLEMDESFLRRPLNEGFSGGEKKRAEIFQMLLMEPRLAILDESDSGLDIDALRVVANAVNSMRSPDRTMLVITHYARVLEYLVPDRTHVILDGRIVKSGGPELADELEQKGYRWIEEEVAAQARSR